MSLLVLLRQTAAAYTLTAGQGSFTLSGQVAALYPTGGKSGEAAPLPSLWSLYTPIRALTAGQGSFALTGQAVAFPRSRIFTAAYGSVTLTGEAVTLTPDYRGQAGEAAPLPSLATLYKPQPSLTAGQGSFTLTGQVVALKAQRLLTAAQASFTLTGQSIAVRWYHLTAAQGSFALTGEAATLAWGHNLSAEQGAFTLTGEDASLKHYALTAAYGTFTLTGNDAAFAVGAAGAKTLSATCGTFALAGQSVDLIAPASAPPRSLLWSGSRLRDREPIRRAEIEPEHEPLPRRIRFFTDSGQFSLSGQAVGMWIDDTASTLAIALAA